MGRPHQYQWVWEPARGKGRQGQPGGGGNGDSAWQGMRGGPVGAADGATPFPHSSRVRLRLAKRRGCPSTRAMSTKIPDVGGGSHGGLSPNRAVSCQNFTAVAPLLGMPSRPAGCEDLFPRERL